MHTAHRRGVEELAAERGEPMPGRAGLTVGGDQAGAAQHAGVLAGRGQRDSGTAGGKTVGEQLMSWTRKVVLSDDWRRAYVVDDSPFAEAGHQPTTIARDWDRLLRVDSQFDAWPGTAPYTVNVVPGVR